MSLSEAEDEEPRSTPEKRDREEASGDDDDDDSPSLPEDPPAKRPATHADADPARRTPLDGRAFVPAPLNDAGLLSRETQNLRRQQRSKEENGARYSWLAKPRDERGHSVQDPLHDGRTLMIPLTVLSRMTPFEKQYWEIKKENWDVVVFFKKGKFYELYEMDADIGHQQFGLKLTPRVNMRMVGFPESSFSTWCKQFIYKGYKVGRVEQMEHRLLKDKPDDRAPVQRRLCQILTLGTLTEEEMLIDHRPHYLLAVREDPVVCGYGICYVDAARGEFYLGRLEDGPQRIEFATLLHRTKPKEVVYERDGLSKASQSLLRRELVDPIENRLPPDPSVWNADAVRSRLGAIPAFASPEVRPEGLTRYWGDDLVLAALGGCLAHLQRLRLDEELLAMGRLLDYNRREDPGRHLVLDGITLANLEVLETLRDRTTEGTILQLVNRCVTPMGRREMRRWVCAPLRHAGDIAIRQGAVDCFIQSPELRSLLEALRGLPDLERMVPRVFAGGRDVQQVAWVDAEVASRKQVALFLGTVAGLRRVWTTWGSLEAIAASIPSPYLRALCSVEGSGAGGRMPDISGPLQYFETSVDPVRLKKEGRVIPNPGVSPEYDAATQECAAIERRLGEILKHARDFFSDERVAYRSVGKEQHQIEVPVQTLHHKRCVPEGYTRMSETKGVQRFWTPELQEKSAELRKVQMRRDEALAGVLRRIMHQFGEQMDRWLACARLVAEADCLLALALGALQPGMCRPEFVDSAGGPLFEARGLRHPCVRPAAGSRATGVVPNDVVLGGQVPATMLLTGPNMGGKSTAMRAVCLAALMAQLGGYVCAKTCRLTPVDRIFTRIGASDRILAGQSTFMVELEETATILHHATVASLVIVDELGRGTSTFDGYAIAYSTLKHIAQTLRCRTIFSTHYHVLGEEMAAECGDVVAPYHMHYALDPATGAVTFLYQLRPGVCPKSYGIDVARKAGLPSWLLDEAQARAADFERQSPLAAFARETQLKTILRRLGDIANGRVPRSELPALQRAAAAYLAHHGPP